MLERQPARPANSFLSPSKKEASRGFWLGLMLALCAVAVVFSSVITVKPGEMLVVSRFGAFQAVYSPGLHWTLPFIESRTLIDTNLVNTANAAGTFLTKDGSVVQMKVGVGYTVSDPKIYVFQPNVNAVLAEKLRAAALQLALNHDLGSLLNQNNAQNFAAEVLTAFPAVSTEGVSLTGVSINSIAVPDRLSQNFNTALSAAQTKVNTAMNAANQFAASLTPLATASANLTLVSAQNQQFLTMIKAQKDAATLEALAPAYQMNPGATLAYLPLLLRAQGPSGGGNSSASGATNSGSANAQSAYARWHASNDQGAQSNADEDN